jgi:hypothetical protein
MQVRRERVQRGWLSLTITMSTFLRSESAREPESNHTTPTRSELCCTWSVPSWGLAEKIKWLILDIAVLE